MTFSTLVQFLFEILSGHWELLPAAVADSAVLLLLFAATLLSLAVVLAQHRHYSGTFLSPGGAAVLSWFFYSGQAGSFDMYAGRVFAGGNPGGADASVQTTLDGCQRLCASRERCAAFTYDYQMDTCFPKSAITAMYPLANAVSGIKRGTPRGNMAAHEPFPSW